MEMMMLGPMMMSMAVFLAVLGIVATFAYARWWQHRSGIDIGAPLLWALLFGFFVARVTYVVLFWSAFKSDPLSIVFIWQGGFEPMSGVAGALLFGAVYGLRKGLKPHAMQMPMIVGLVVWLGLGGIFGALKAQHDMPDFVLHDLDGAEVSLSEFRGQPVVVNLWATWCPPCRREMPVLGRAQQANPQVHFVFANQREAPETIEAYLATEDFGLENVLRDSSGELARHFGAYGMPVTLFFDRHGQLADSHLGEVSAARLQQSLERLRAR